MATSYMRGHEIYYDGDRWRYSNIDVPIDDWTHRPCVRCHMVPTKEGYDACLGHIEGAVAACCGHGVTMKIVESSEHERGS